MSTDRNVATVQAPSNTPGAADIRLSTFTFFTRVTRTSEILYHGDRMWTKVTLTLLTAGPVSVGQQSDVFPVTSGKGQQLQPGVPVVFNVAKSNDLYVAATSLNAIAVLIEPYPWLETIVGLLSSGAPPSAVAAAMGGPAPRPGSKI